MLLIGLLITGIVLAAGLAWVEGVTAAKLPGRLLLPLCRMLAFVGIGLVVAQAIDDTGWTRKIGALAASVFRFANLGHRCSAAFTAAFFSGVSANAMLLDFYKEKQITRRQLFLTNFINQFPAFFLHLPTTMFIVLPLTGTAGALYFLLTFLATLLRTILFLTFGHFYLKISEDRTQPPKPEASRPSSFKRVKDRIQKRLPARIVNILIWVLPIYTLVFILHLIGAFDSMNRALSAHISTQMIPVESLSIVILSFAAEFTSGFAAAGALLDAGILTVKQTVLALLLGNILAFPIRALRHQLPRYMGIFSPKMGLQLLLSGQFFRISSLILTGFIYFLVA